MKKVLFLLALLIGFAFQPVFAKTTPVQTLQDFSIQNPSKTLLIKILSNIQLGNGVMLHEGYYVLGQIMDVSNSTFVFMPVKYQNFHNEVFQINGNFPAKFVGMIDSKTKAPANGVIAKDSKFILDFIETDNKQEQPVSSKYQNVKNTEGGISAVVNRTEPVLYDGSIPQTMKDFPGIQLDSFDNGSNFNIPDKLIIEAEIRDNNINSLKQ